MTPPVCASHANRSYAGPEPMVALGVTRTYASAGRLPGRKVRVAAPLLTVPPAAALMNVEPAGGGPRALAASRLDDSRRRLGTASGSATGSGGGAAAVSSGVAASGSVVLLPAAAASAAAGWTAECSGSPAGTAVVAPLRPTAVSADAPATSSPALVASPESDGEVGAVADGAIAGSIESEVRCSGRALSVRTSAVTARSSSETTGGGGGVETTTGAGAATGVVIGAATGVVTGAAGAVA